MVKVTPTPDIFAFLDFRAFLAAWMAAHGERGESARSLARKMGINSPNYLQRIARGDKGRITPATVAKLAKGFDLTGAAARYLACLVRLEQESDVTRKAAVLEEAMRLAKTAAMRRVRDETIYSNWLNFVVFELAATDGFTCEIEAIHARLRGFAGKAEVQGAVDFLLAKGYLREDEAGQVRRGKVQFEVINDRRLLDVRRNHMRFLDLAKLSISDPIDERELQGLTIAVDRTRFPALKQRIREFAAAIGREFGGDPAADAVVHLQSCAYFVTKAAGVESVDAEGAVRDGEGDDS